MISPFFSRNISMRFGENEVLKYIVVCITYIQVVYSISKNNFLIEADTDNQQYRGSIVNKSFSPTIPVVSKGKDW